MYLLFALVSLFEVALCPGPKKIEFSTMGTSGRVEFLTLSIFVSAAPAAWFWLEARAFDDWVKSKAEIEQKQLRETFKLNADGERAFWAAIVAVWAALI